MLLCLKIFHFPQIPPSDPEENENQQSEKSARWPDSLETFHISSSLHTGYIPAIENAPASMKSLIIEDGCGIDREVLKTIFDLIGSRTLTLKVGHNAGQMASLFIKFPNLLDLSVSPIFVSEHRKRHIPLEIDHPLRSITINLNEINVIYDTKFIERLKALLKENRLPNIRSLLLSARADARLWVGHIRQYPWLLLRTDLLIISAFLKKRSSSASGFEKSGVWLANSDDNDSIICEFTKENLEIIKVDRPGLRVPTNLA
jgi:hypothetical protein